MTRGPHHHTDARTDAPDSRRPRPHRQLHAIAPWRLPLKRSQPLFLFSQMKRETRETNSATNNPLTNPSSKLGLRYGNIAKRFHKRAQT